MNEEFNHYLESKKKWIDIIKNIESNLFVLNNDNYQRVEEILLQTHFSSSCESTINFLDLVIIAMRSRPQNTSLYLRLLKHFEKPVQRYKIDNQIFNQIHPQQPTFYDYSFFEQENNNEEDDFSNNKNTNDSLFRIIANDDIDKFQYIISHYDIMINSTVDIDHITVFNFFKPGTRISLIDLASYFSSIQIFKFLFLSNADITEETFSYAIFGGCPDIIHILEEKKKIKFQFKKEHLIIAIQTHQQNIVEYIINNIDKNEVEFISPEIISQSIEFYNLNFFVTHINEMVEQLENKNDVIDNNGLTLTDLYSRLLFDCIRCRHVDMLDVLLHAPLLNVNVKNVLFEGIEGTIIHAAARIENHSYMKYILNCDQIDANILTNCIDNIPPKLSSARLYAKGLTALHIAVIRRDVELVKILLKTDKISKNELNGSVRPNKLNNSVQSNIINPNIPMPINNETPLHFACRNNCKEIIQILINDPRTDTSPLRIPRFKFFDGRTPADISLMHFDLESFRMIKKAGGKMSKQFLFIFIFQMFLFLFSIGHITATVLKKTDFNLYLTILEIGTIFRLCSSSINDDIFDQE